jgi:hypothetical protein
MPESKTRPEIKFEYIKTNRPPPKNVLQEIAREFEEEAKEKKANEGKQTPAQLKKIKGLQDKFLGKMKRPRTGLKPMRPLMREAAKGMRKGFGSKSMKSAAKKMKRIM